MSAPDYRNTRGAVCGHLLFLQWSTGLKHALLVEVNTGIALLPFQCFEIILQALLFR